jgi:2-oxoglutarate dehydrogenase complex dehydrogenase (E1) component-like enzyme
MRFPYLSNYEGLPGRAGGLPYVLGEILNIVRNTYCRNIGAEYMHINETEQKRWIQHYLESCESTPDFSVDKKKHILGLVIAANALEEYLHTKYVGQKRFSWKAANALSRYWTKWCKTAGIMAPRRWLLAWHTVAV